MPAQLGFAISRAKLQRNFSQHPRAKPKGSSTINIFLLASGSEAKREQHYQHIFLSIRERSQKGAALSTYFSKHPGA
jgi:hypothetical protein